MEPSLGGKQPISVNVAVFNNPPQIRQRYTKIPPKRVIRSEPKRLRFTSHQIREFKETLCTHKNNSLETSQKSIPCSDHALVDMTTESLQVVVKQSARDDSPQPRQIPQSILFQSLQTDLRNTRTPDSAMFPKVIPKLHQYRKRPPTKTPEWHLQGHLTTLSPRKTAMELRG